MPKPVWPVLAALLLVASAAPPKRQLPPPLRVYIPYESAWEGMHEVLRTEEVKIHREDRTRGFIVSDFHEFMSGPLTARSLGKVGQPPKVSDGDYVKARYQYEVLIEFIRENEVIITVHANIQALKRGFLGGLDWVSIPTLGNLEEDLLTAFGTNLFGQSFRLDQPKVGFWERDPTYLPDLSQKIPTIARPERP